ncbi:predicted protein [Histoplasma mississippiense (nom. inval.)]|uniref:predicted protein n=1 Tax=Ajellomyces capsulatus (strain NAm1 / WU24) TaxID=2059318 RepID=UPI000157D0D1|nr:predicted protein [Histoplasma mississippiense (nom. inval.)]EDN04280.1 predicted protein [Histoplasma mississippiense (nom. inval.)]
MSFVNSKSFSEIIFYVCIKHGQRPCFRSLPKGMETCYAGEISMYTERENRIQVATLEKTQLIALSI